MALTKKQQLADSNCNQAQMQDPSTFQAPVAMTLIKKKPLTDRSNRNEAQAQA
jgi:hypothetical protein